MIQTLDPGEYTVVLRGEGDTAGVALVEAYDLSPAGDSQLANISSRGVVGTNANVMIGGFIVGPAGSARVIVRALGPSLAQSGITDRLEDPMLELHTENGATIASNDDWADSQQADVQATGIPPNDRRESAIVTALPAGKYTAVMRGKSNATGVGLVEVYNLQ